MPGSWTSWTNQPCTRRLRGCTRWRRRTGSTSCRHGTRSRPCSTCMRSTSRRSTRSAAPRSGSTNRGSREVKLVLEQRFRARLGGDEPVSVADDVTDAFRAIAHEDMVPAVYDWLAGAADRADLVEFLALEGGPDADFDDLVALCQIGLSGLPKLTLAANYWDEMGRGSLAAGAHRAAPRHGRRALGVRTIPTDHLPLEVLERRALNGYLATNRSLQPEMLGSLGLLEVQAGPRCRRVVHGDAPPRRPDGRVALLRGARDRRSAARQGLDRRRARAGGRRPSGLGTADPARGTVARGRERTVLRRDVRALRAGRARPHERQP